MFEKISLAGEWHFTFEDGSQTRLPVPGCFDVSDKYRFRRGKGCYSRTVSGSGMMELACDGLGLRAEIFWNGNKIYSETTAYTPFKVRFDAGCSGVHELKIICDNTIEETPESEFRSFYDFYGFGGIYREITLRRLPETFFDSVRVLPDMETGCIDLQVTLGGKEQPLTVWIDHEICGKMPGSGSQTFRIASPRVWCPEEPELHCLRLECGGDVYECRFGFRKIEIRNGQFYLNGKLLKLAGVNRHDVFPDTGAAVNREQLYNDLKMIKDAGFNIIRGAHYPQSQMMLDLADELGLLVWDEILGWENPVDSLTDAEFQKRQSNALTRMIQKSINHPCIIMWGFLNEAATNDTAARDCVAKLYRTAKEQDPSRPVAFASMFGEKDLCLDLTDVVCFNTYPGWYGGTHTFFEPGLVTEQLEKLASFVRNTPELADKPVIISEIGAASLIGDHSKKRWSEEYQAQLVECAVDYTLSHKELGGIILWQFCNSPVADNVRIMMRPRGYNNKGLVDEYRRPKMVWNLFPDLLKKYFSR